MLSRGMVEADDNETILCQTQFHFIRDTAGIYYKMKLSFSFLKYLIPTYLLDLNKVNFVYNKTQNH